MRILLVEDDSMIGNAMQTGLRAAGYSVDWVLDGAAGLTAASDAVYDAVLLDLGLPKRGGMELRAALRSMGVATPVVIVTAREDVKNRIAGLDAGADDYVLKPFDLDELLARVRAVIRRRGDATTSIARQGALRLDNARRAVTLDGKPVAVSAREFAVLEVLMQREGAVVSRRRLEDAVYDWRDDIGSNAIEVHIHNLRKKLGVHRIVNVRGLGYRVSADDA